MMMLDKQELFAEIASYFDVPASSISEHTVASDVEGWDSLTHVTLLLALEEKYRTEFTPAEIAGLDNVGDFYDYLEKKLAT